MENHNTHIVSEQSKGGHGYKYDNFGNVMIDSIDDLIYDKFVDVKRKKNAICEIIINDNINGFGCLVSLPILTDNKNHFGILSSSKILPKTELKINKTIN